MDVMVTFGEAAIARPDLLAFESAFPLLFRAAYRVAYRLIANQTEAEDVAQEACARAYSRWSTVRDHAEPWCVRVASNLALDQLRARQRAARRNERLRGGDAATGRSVAPATSHAVDDRLDLYAALNELSRRQRQAIVLRYLGDLSESQVADLLSCSVGAVKTHTSRGMARLREVLPQ